MKPSSNIATFRSTTVLIPGTAVHTIPGSSMCYVRTLNESKNSIEIARHSYTTSRAIVFIETFCLHGIIAYLNE